MSGLRYGHGPEILRDISFSLAPGEFRFLTGPSGAGKTSLLRLLFLSLAPTRGLMSLFGQDTTSIGRTRPAAPAPPHRHRVPGIPPARPPDGL